MNERQDQTDQQVHEELNAYLDGELDSEGMAKIERRLAEDPPFRKRLQSLQAAWDMLDYLPRAAVDEEFTKTTVEMVAVKAADYVKEKKSTVIKQRRLGWLAGVGGALACGVGGFLLSHHMLSQPNRLLVEDLPVIENVDIYRQVNSFDFLLQLDEENLFAAEVDDGM